MKSILKSFRPKTVVNILNGDATLFISKDVRLYKATMKLIEEQGYATFFMYCTKDNENELVQLVNCYDSVAGYDLIPSKLKIAKRIYNGKVVAKFTVRKVEEIKPFEEYDSPMGLAYKLTEEKIITCQKAQLTYDEYNRYLKGKNGYAYHIEDLVIFDKPKELSEFKRASCKGCFAENTNYCDEKYCRITKAPQNFVFVESEE